MDVDGCLFLGRQQAALFISPQTRHSLKKRAHKYIIAVPYWDRELSFFHIIEILNIIANDMRNIHNRLGCCPYFDKRVIPPPFADALTVNRSQTWLFSGNLDIFVLQQLGLSNYPHFCTNICYIYFDQPLGAVHSRSWLKKTFLNFFNGKKLEKEKKAKNLQQNLTKNGFCKGIV